MLWRFDTSRLEWEVVEYTVANGAAPSVRYGHVMTSVGGLNLWLHGGDTVYPPDSGEGDGCSTHAAPLLLHRDNYCISLYLVTAAAATVLLGLAVTVCAVVCYGS